MRIIWAWSVSCSGCYLFVESSLCFCRDPPSITPFALEPGGYVLPLGLALLSPQLELLLWNSYPLAPYCPTHSSLSEPACSPVLGNLWLQCRSYDNSSHGVFALLVSLIRGISWTPPAVSNQTSTSACDVWRNQSLLGLLGKKVKSFLLSSVIS